MMLRSNLGNHLSQGRTFNNFKLLLQSKKLLDLILKLVVAQV